MEKQVIQTVHLLHSRMQKIKFWRIASSVLFAILSKKIATLKFRQDLGTFARRLELHWNFRLQMNCIVLKRFFSNRLQLLGSKSDHSSHHHSLNYFELILSSIPGMKMIVMKIFRTGYCFLSMAFKI